MTHAIDLQGNLRKWLSALLAVSLLLSSLGAPARAYADFLDVGYKDAESVKDAAEDSGDHKGEHEVTYKDKDQAYDDDHPHYISEEVYESFKKLVGSDEPEDKPSSEITSNEKSFFTVGSAAANHIETKLSKVSEGGNTGLGLGDSSSLDS